MKNIILITIALLLLSCNKESSSIAITVNSNCELYFDGVLRDSFTKVKIEETRSYVLENGKHEFKAVQYPSGKKWSVKGKLERDTYFYISF